VTYEAGGQSPSGPRWRLPYQSSHRRCGVCTRTLKAEDAARNAYYAAFHAAKALIFERTSQTHKSHGGVHKLFAQLARTEPAIDQALRTFLIKAYDFKRIADYDVGLTSPITPKRAADAVAEAGRFAAAIATVLSS